MIRGRPADHVEARAIEAMLDWLWDGDIHYHALTHVRVSDALGPRLVPACTCGWYSPDGSHWRFERHLREATDD